MNDGDLPVSFGISGEVVIIGLFVFAGLFVTAFIAG